MQTLFDDWEGVKKRIDLKILDFLSYYYTTYTIKRFYSSVDNHPKLNEIGKNCYKGYKGS